MNLSHYPFAGVLLPYAAGISLYFYQHSFNVIFALPAFAVLFFLCLKAGINRLQTIFTCCWILGGYLTCLSCDETKRDAYFGRQSPGENDALFGYLSGNPENYSGGIRTIMQVHSIYKNGKHKKSCGALLLYIQADSSAKNKFAYGTQWIIPAGFEKIKGAKNPGQFSPSAHFRKQGIYLMQRITAEKMQYCGNKGGSFIVRQSMQLREKLLEMITSCHYSKSQRALISALLLGYDDDVSPETFVLYAQTGVMHILSVSGLHIGILFIAFQFILRWMENHSSLKILRLMLLLAALWTYAILTGLSSPVVRACLMFSLILTGKAMNRNIVPLNLLFATAWLMLLANPLWLFTTGFQLSFLAISGILLLNPILDAPVNEASALLRMLWQSATASVSATLFTLPVTLYTFGQFAWFFIPANMIAIPLSTLLMYGVIADVFVVTPILQTDWLTYANTFLLDSMNSALGLICRVPGAVTEHIYPEKTTYVVIILTLFFLTIYLHNKKKYQLMAFLFLLFLIPCSEIMGSYIKKDRNMLLIYSCRKGTCLEYITGTQSLCVSTMDIPHEMEKVFIKSRAVLGIKHAQAKKFLTGESVNITFKGFPDLCLDANTRNAPSSGLLVSKSCVYLCRPDSGLLLLRNTRREGACILYLNNAKNPIVSPFEETNSYD